MNRNKKSRVGRAPRGRARSPVVARHAALARAPRLSTAWASQHASDEASAVPLPEGTGRSHGRSTEATSSRDPVCGNGETARRERRARPRLVHTHRSPLAALHSASSLRGGAYTPGRSTTAHGISYRFASRASAHPVPKAKRESDEKQAREFVTRQSMPVPSRQQVILVVESINVVSGHEATYHPSHELERQSQCGSSFGAGEAQVYPWQFEGRS